MSIDFTRTIREVTANLKYTLAQGIVIPPTAAGTFSESVLNNANITGFSTTTGLDVVYETTKESDKSSKPKDVSYQVLIEPLKAVSPHAMSNPLVGVASNHAQAIAGSSPDTVKKASALSANPSAVDNASLKASTEAASRKLATTAFTEANASDRGTGNFLTAAHGDNIVAGSSLKFHSDTNIFSRAPQHLVSTQDYHVQANNSIVEATGTHIGNYSNKVVTVDGSHVENVQTSVHISTANRDVVSKTLNMTGIDTVKTMGDNNLMVAASNLISSSGGSSQYTSQNDHQVNAGGSISIISSPSPQTPDAGVSGVAHASGDPSAIVDTIEGIVSKLDNTIRIVSSHLVSKNVISMTKEGTSHSSSTSIAMMAGMDNYSTGAQVYSIALAGGISFYGNQITGTITFGDKQFAGFPAPLPALPVPFLPLLPAIPALPSLPIAQLENCIPDKFKNKDGTFSTSGNILKSPEEIADAIINPPAPDSPTTTGKPTVSSSEKPAPKVFDSNTESKTNPKQAPRNTTTSEKTAISTDKSPGLTISAPANKDTIPAAACIDTSGVSTPDIYPELYSATDYVFQTLPLDGASFEGTKDLVDVDTLKGTKLIITADFINENLSFLPTDIFSKVTPDVFSALAAGGPIPITGINSTITLGTDSTTQNLSDFLSAATSRLEEIINESTKLIARPIPGYVPSLIGNLNSIVDYLQENPQDAEAFNTAINTSLASLAIGSIPQLISSVVNDLKELPKLIKSGSIASYLKFAQSTLSAVGVNNPQLNSLIGLGSVLANPTTENIRSAVNQVVSNQLAPLLPGIPLASIVSAVSPLIGNPNVTQDQITSSLTTALGAIPGIGPAASSLVPILKKASKGDFTAILTQSGITSIASLVLGSKNAAQVEKIGAVFSTGKDLVKSLNSIPQLLKLMNSYKIPALTQISLALGCLDLFNKLRALISAFSNLDFSTGQSSSSDLISSQAAADFIDNTPYYIQVINSIQSIPGLPTTEVGIEEALLNPNTDPTILGILKELTQYTTPKELALLLNLKTDADLITSPNTCFSIPFLSLAESSVEIERMDGEYAYFSLTNPQLLINDVYKLPQIGDILYISAPTYNSGIGLLEVYSDDYQFTSSNLKMYISSYDPNTNKGIAYYQDRNLALLLRKPEGLLYEYKINSIGYSLFPLVTNSYIVK